MRPSDAPLHVQPPEPPGWQEGSSSGELFARGGGVPNVQPTASLDSLVHSHSWANSPLLGTPLARAAAEDYGFGGTKQKTQVELQDSDSGNQAAEALLEVQKTNAVGGNDTDKYGGPVETNQVWNSTSARKSQQSRPGWVPEGGSVSQVEPGPPGSPGSPGSPKSLPSGTHLAANEPGAHNAASESESGIRHSPVIPAPPGPYMGRGYSMGQEPEGHGEGVQPRLSPEHRVEEPTGPLSLQSTPALKPSSLFSSSSSSLSSLNPASADRFLRERAQTNDEAAQPHSITLREAHPLPGEDPTEALAVVPSPISDTAVTSTTTNTPTDKMTSDTTTPDSNVTAPAGNVTDTFGSSQTSTEPTVEEQTLSSVGNSTQEASSNTAENSTAGESSPDVRSHSKGSAPTTVSRQVPWVPGNQSGPALDPSHSQPAICLGKIDIVWVVLAISVPVSSCCEY